MNRVPTQCDTIDIAGIGEKPAHRSGPVGLDRVHMRGRDDLDGLVPRRADQAALAPRLLIAPRRSRGRRRSSAQASTGSPRRCLASRYISSEHAADVGVANPGGRVGVPGEGRPAGTAAGLVLGSVRADGGVVGLLRLPGDDAVLDVHLPRAGARAVHAVRGAHDLVVAPPVTVEDVASATALAEDRRGRRPTPPTG